MQAVVARPAIHDIVATAAKGQVVALATEDPVAARPGADRVIPLAAVKEVVALIVEQKVVALIALQRVIAKPPSQRIVARAAQQQVVAVVAPELIVAEPPVQRVIADPSIKPVVAVLAMQHVVAVITLQRVAAGSPEQHVIARAAAQHVVSGLAPQRIVAVVAPELIVAAAAEKPIPACAAAQRVVAFVSGQLVIACPALKRIVAVTALERVVAILAQQRVIAAAAAQKVIAAAAGQVIGPRPGNQRVVARPAQQAVVALQRLEVVVAGLAREGVVAAATEQPVIAVAPVKQVIAAPTLKDVIAIPAIERVIALVPVQRVVAGIAKQRVVARTAKDQVVAVSAAHHIIARPRAHRVVAPPGRDGVIAAARIDHLGAGAAQQQVRPFGAEHPFGHVRGRVLGADPGRVQFRQQVMRDREQHLVREIADGQRPAGAGPDVDDHLARHDQDAGAGRNEAQLPDAADIAQQRQVQPVDARLVVGDRDCAAHARHDEQIGPGAARQADLAAPGHQDVVARAARQMRGQRARQQQVVAAGAVLGAGAGLGRQADPAGVKDELRDPGLGRAGHEQHHPPLDHQRADHADIGQGGAVGVLDRHQMQQPSVRHQREDRDPVIRAAHEQQGAAVHLDAFHGGDGLKAGRALVDDVVGSGQPPLPVQPKDRDRVRPAPAQDDEAAAPDLDHLQLRGLVIAHPPRRDMQVARPDMPAIRHQMRGHEIAVPRDRDDDGLAIDLRHGHPVDLGAGRRPVRRRDRQRRLPHQPAIRAYAMQAQRQPALRDQQELAPGQRQLLHRGDPARRQTRGEGRAKAGHRAVVDPVGQPQIGRAAQLAQMQQVAPAKRQQRDLGRAGIGKIVQIGPVSQQLQRQVGIADRVAGYPAADMGRREQHEPPVRFGDCQIGDVGQPAFLRDTEGGHVAKGDHDVQRLR